LLAAFVVAVAVGVVLLVRHVNARHIEAQRRAELEYQRDQARLSDEEERRWDKRLRGDT
jgi:hypothetical protein